ncbi:hypothetical protein KSP35_12555 [Aquihabitans sp. G128]|uniref:hypothetical protein n=1 Tax=Aquihabitans sp. G128 TaxID=2849779 RepID=UPI001C22C450|nr:hypothetical protein [Aquihabitans sp. G128]QXC59239.1 hypothetical protein KSP35_12555 [Aquihabitans sp. G128]
MKHRPSLAALVAAEWTRVRCRPVVGRLPLLLGAATGGSAALLFAGGIDLHAAQQLDAVSGTVAMALVVLSFGIGAATVQDTFTSGTAATDHALVGRRRAELVAQQVGAAAWLAVLGLAVQLGLATGFVLGHAAQRGAAISAGAWQHAVVLAMPRTVAAAALAGGLGASTVQLTRSAPAALGALATCLLVLDGLVATLAPAAVGLILPDHLFALGKGSTTGLAAADWSVTSSSVAAVLGVVAVAGVAALVEGARDLP